MIVFLILCDIFDDLPRYLQRGPVWLAECGENKQLAAKIWAAGPRENPLTTFRASSDDICSEIDCQLSSVYEHHPEWSEIRIIRSLPQKPLAQHIKD